MRKSLALFLGLLGTVSLAKAQEEASKVDLYGGYYYARFNVNANVPGIAPSATYIGKGGAGQLEYNAKNWLGVVGDLGGFYATSSGNGSFAGGVFTYLLGPRVNFRHGTFTPFLQALFGGVRTTDGIAQSTGTENNFAMTAGGGIDFKVSRHASVRPIQAEYFMTKIPTVSTTARTICGLAPGSACASAGNSLRGCGFERRLVTSTGFRTESGNPEITFFE